jgi:Tol biopolymer transport system component
MRAAVVSVGFALLAALSIAGGRVAVSAAAAETHGESVAIVASGRAAATASRADGSTRVELPWLLPGDTGAAVSPDGHRVTFSSARSGSSEIYVVDTRSGDARRLTANPEADDVEPAWSPDGRQIVWSSGKAGSRDLFVMRADGSSKRRVVEDAANDVEPAWSPDGTSIAFASNRRGRYQLWSVEPGGGEPSSIVDATGSMRAPAWSPSGRKVAFTGSTAGNADVWVGGIDGSPPVRLTTSPAFDGRPAWSPDGRRIAFVSTRDGSQRIWLMRADGSRQQALERSEVGDDTPHWSPVSETISPDSSSLLPDLDQQAPSGILVMRSGGRIRLGFTSAVDNVGDGPIHIRGTRPGNRRTMRANQLVHRRDGTVRVVSDVGRLAYESHPPHFHWHLAPYQAYELHSVSDSTVMRRDRKSGFCLLDRWGYAIRRPGIVPGPPKFVGDCAARRPDARRVDEGSSVGYTDRYPGFFHGQDIDITGLDPGLYVLVHRANPERLVRELRYSNNASSVLIRISSPDVFTGAPTATIVRRCPESDTCVP